MSIPECLFLALLCFQSIAPFSLPNLEVSSAVDVNSQVFDSSIIISISQKRTPIWSWLALQCHFWRFPYHLSSTGSCLRASWDRPLPCSIFKMLTRAKTKNLNTNSRSSSAGSSGLIRPAFIVEAADQGDIAPSSPLFATSPLSFPSTESLSSGNFWAPGKAQ